MQMDKMIQLKDKDYEIAFIKYSQHFVYETLLKQLFRKVREKKE